MFVTHNLTNTASAGAVRPGSTEDQLKESAILSIDTMATRFELVLHGEDSSRLRGIGEEALYEIEEWGDRLSIYASDSEMHWINARAADEPVKTDARLFHLIERCSKLSALTGGTFDISVAPLMRVWGFMGGTGQVPDPAEITKAMDVVGMTHVCLDPERFGIGFDRKGVMLDLGAVGKGFAIERAAGILREHGITSALLHGGTSTVYAIGTQPDGSPWKIAIQDPRNQHKPLDVVELRDSSLSVSAVHGKSFFHKGRQLGHVIDPRTGQPVQGAQAAVVIGPSPTDCDALSTALLVLGESGLSLLVERFPGYRGIVAVE